MDNDTLLAMGQHGVFFFGAFPIFPPWSLPLFYDPLLCYGVRLMIVFAPFDS